ncbi:hypothetical protein SAMN05444149_102690 [Pseudosulfitobacter pseudonitzschiae]|uniref:hypothetical protein n=1 Tax=Pseudosulfitobacter pseudonitzschiae TaxID=1402135 RepID=UPI0009247650|nr:hypothetical protein [Pseudosulfitobacter pseudonitzschiae]SHF04956.1 hypothetical protein SAMN05444149_102690 [Pseudosulfitobacter pseudonitzschiae]
MKYVSLPEFCRQIGIHPATMYRWLADPESGWALAPVKRNGRNYFVQSQATAAHEAMMK